MYLCLKASIIIIIQYYMGNVLQESQENTKPEATCKVEKQSPIDMNHKLSDTKSCISEVQKILQKYQTEKIVYQKQHKDLNNNTNQNYPNGEQLNQDYENTLYKIVLKIRNASDIIALITKCHKRIQDLIEKQKRISSKHNRQKWGDKNRGINQGSNSAQTQVETMRQIRAKISQGQSLYQQNLKNIDVNNLLIKRIPIPYQVLIDYQIPEQSEHQKQEKTDMLWRQLPGKYKDILMRYRQLPKGIIQTVERQYTGLSISALQVHPFILDLSNKILTEQFVKKIGQYQWEQVEVLEMNYCNITDLSWNVLAQSLKCFSNLKLMTIYGNHIQQISLLHLEALPESLQYVDFSHLESGNRLSQNSILNIYQYLENNPQKTFLFDNTSSSQISSDQSL